MSLRALIEKINAINPDFDIKEADIESHKPTVMRDFYLKLLRDFEVDVDSIKRVYVCQQVTEDSEMIPTINLNCAINSIIRHNVPIGLFDLITPDNNIILARMAEAIQFYEFCDDIMNCLFEYSKAHTDGYQRLRAKSGEASEMEKRIGDMRLKITHQANMNEEAIKEIHEIEQEQKKVIDSRRSIEHEIQLIRAQNEIVMRKKQQRTGKISEIKLKLVARRKVLDRSSDCDNKLEKLEKELENLKEEKSRIIKKSDEERATLSDTAKLKQTLVSRCNPAKEILDLLNTIKLLEKEKEERVCSADTEAMNTKLTQLKTEIEEQEADTKNCTRTCLREINQLDLSVQRKRELVSSNKTKRTDLKGKFTDMGLIERRNQELEQKGVTMKENFKRERDRLKEMEEKVAKSRGMTMELYAKNISATMENIKLE